MRDIIDGLLILYAGYALVGMIASLSANERYDGCPYYSIASRTNLGYVIGCELLRNRWVPR